MRSLLAIVAVFACAANVYAAGGSTAGFLLDPVGARPAAMGGSYTAVGGDGYAMHYNPAGISNSAREVAFQHRENFLDIRQEYISYTHPLGDGHGVSLSANYFDLGDFERTVITNVANPNLPGSVSNAGDFSAGNLAVSLGYARPFFRNDALSVGVTAKYIRQEIDVFTDATYAVDAGALYRFPTLPVSAGISVLNIGPDLRTGFRDERLPRTFRAGAAYTGHDRFILSFDAVKTVGDDWEFMAGVDVRPIKMLSVRAGYTSGRDEGSRFQAGFGIEADRFGFDYAYVPFGSLGESHQFSLSYRWGLASNNVHAPSRHRLKPLYSKLK